MPSMAVVLALLVAAGVAVSSLSRSSVEASSLKWVSVDRGTVDVAISGTGEVVPAFEEVINSPITSRIVEVYHRSGDVVEAGTPLIRLDLEATRTAPTTPSSTNSLCCAFSWFSYRANNRTRLSDLRMQDRGGTNASAPHGGGAAQRAIPDSIGAAPPTACTRWSLTETRPGWSWLSSKHN